MKWWVASICFIFSLIFFFLSGITIPNTIEYGPIHPLFFSFIFMGLFFVTFSFFWSSRHKNNDDTIPEEIYDDIEQKNSELNSSITSFLQRILPLIVYVFTLCVQVLLYSWYGFWNMWIVCIQVLYNISFFSYFVLLPYSFYFSSKAVKYTSLFASFFGIIFSGIYVYIQWFSIHILLFLIYGILFHYHFHARYENIISLCWSVCATFLFFYSTFLFFSDMYF